MPAMLWRRVGVIGGRVVCCSTQWRSVETTLLRVSFMLPSLSMKQLTTEILVVGATGRQGGAVTRHLRRHGYGLRALCRDPESKAAQALSAEGVRVVKGNLEDRSSLDEAVNGAHGVFCVTDYWDGFPANKLGSEREARQGCNLLDAAKAAGVEHVVQASGAGVTIAPELDANRGKRLIEEHGRALGLELTIIRSAFFMDNFEDPAMGLLDSLLRGKLEMTFDPTTRLQMIAVDDIGHLVAMAFDRRGGLAGTRFDAAGDELTMVDIAETIARVMGRPVRYTGSSAGLSELRKYHPEMADLFESVNRFGFQAFIPGLRALHPEMLTFEAYLRRSGWATRSAA